jgi:type II secretory pathway component PulF
MVQQEVSPKKESPEPFSLEMHRKQSFWQITFPIILASFFMVVVMILLIVFSGGFGDNLTSIGAAAAVFVMLPHFLGLLIWLAILAGLAYGVYALRKALPKQGVATLAFLQNFQLLVHKYGNVAAQPSIKWAYKAAQAKQFITSLKQRLR